MDSPDIVFKLHKSSGYATAFCIPLPPIFKLDTNHFKRWFIQANIATFVGEVAILAYISFSLPSVCPLFDLNLYLNFYSEKG